VNSATICHSQCSGLGRSRDHLAVYLAASIIDASDLAAATAELGAPLPYAWRRLPIMICWIGYLASMRSRERDAPPTPKVGTPRHLKLRTAGLLGGLLIVVLVAMAAWLYFLARLGRDLATWIFS
jgi:hypothetical protein